MPGPLIGVSRSLQNNPVIRGRGTPKISHWTRKNPPSPAHRSRYRFGPGSMALYRNTRHSELPEWTRPHRANAAAEQAPERPRSPQDEYPSSPAPRHPVESPAAYARFVPDHAEPQTTRSRASSTRQFARLVRG